MEKSSSQHLDKSSSSSSSSNVHLTTAANEHQAVESRPGYVSPDHHDSDKWFYLDPQNQVQGPFSADQMAAWYNAGYFQMSLMVKKGADHEFLALGALTTTLGRLPFLPAAVSSAQQPQQPKLNIPQAQTQAQTQQQQSQNISLLQMYLQQQMPNFLR